MNNSDENRKSSLNYYLCIKVILIAIVFVVFILATGSIISGIEFQVNNPFKSAYGIMQVVFTDREYVEIQQSPKVVLAKPSASLKEYMNKSGYIEEENSRLGALVLFKNGEKEQKVTYRVNAYFSVWNWSK